MDTSIGTHSAEVDTAAAHLARCDAINRIWRRDHSLWKPNPAEISNRLGWLNITEMMSEQVPMLASFAGEVREAGFRWVVLLGMGGSSLGAEVLRQTFGSPKGYPELVVLDSTLPARILAVTGAIDPAHTLFLVSSKSGTTIETVCLLQYFLSLAQSAVGKEEASKNFAVITDAGTPLAKRAEEEGWHTFINPSDIGGRYSILSYFGLVPAAVIGIDIKTLLSRANRMRKLCSSITDVHENPGAWLGTVIGVLSLKRRDKLTIITSPTIGSFGLWVEQLIAESTGKEGKGIIPVIDEPLVEPECYGNDRLFVYLRLQSDNNALTDRIIERLKALKQPVIVLELEDVYDLGAEFFRWEFATAIAGAILEVNPFDQSNVDSAKLATKRVLNKFITSGRIPELENGRPFTDLLARVGGDMYLAIQAYVPQTSEADKILGNLRQRYLERYHIATTLGYGPRYLHSTGQLHKGGPATGLYLQITMAHKQDLPIPERPYTFGVLADAQAIGDLEALHWLGRPVTRFHLGRGDVADISQLIEEL